MSDEALYNILFPTASGKVKYKMPDYEHVYKELQRDGVTLDLLWQEYVDECRLAGELPYARYHKGSTILCSQFDVPGWMEQVSNKLTADAICDRFAHDSHKIIIAGDDSMRKRKSTIQ